MSTPRIPHPGMLVLSVLSARLDEIWPGLFRTLEDRFGPAEYVSEPLLFDQTDYYDEELGSPIYRRFLAFETLRPLDELADIKTWTNGLELEYARDGRRGVNLDPGFLTLERLVLATGKNFSHRIYLKDGIWADLTLIWRQGAWEVQAWTFPDYATDDMKTRLTNLRLSYKTKLKQ